MVISYPFIISILIKLLLLVHIYVEWLLLVHNSPSNFISTLLYWFGVEESYYTFRVT